MAARSALLNLLGISAPDFERGDVLGFATIIRYAALITGKPATPVVQPSASEGAASG